MKEIWPYGIIREGFTKWWSSNPTSMGAALAYYTLFSFVPILFIIIFTVGIILGQQVVEGKLVAEIEYVFGPTAVSVVEGILAKFRNYGTGSFASLITIVVLVVGSIGMFREMQISLNKIWNVPSKHLSSFSGLVKREIAAFIMVILLGVVFIVSSILSALSVLLSSFIAIHAPFLLVMSDWINFVASFLIICILFAIIYRYLPNAIVSWRATLIGAAITGILFIIGRFVIGLYIKFSLTALAFGAAGALPVLLMWIYYSALIFYFGAACTCAIDQRLKNGKIYEYDSSERKS